MQGEAKGLIGNLQDLAVHDGPGLRILVFLKGCPLRCRWCQNPENLAFSPEIEYRAILCLGCGRCLEICPVPGAITEDQGKRIHRSLCTRCMRCVEVCLGKALRRVGEWVSAEQLVGKVSRYKPFFDCSDEGGVTLSGGEPTFQPEFARRLLKSFKETGIHTALETCGHCSYENLQKIAEVSDLIIYDLKHMDAEKHRDGTGKSNQVILENLKRLCAEVGTDIVIHVPLICGFNDDDENIRKTAEFVSPLKRIKRVDLLPFNELASAKYRILDLMWEYEKVRQQSQERLAVVKEIVKSYGLETTIGGLV